MIYYRVFKYKVTDFNLIKIGSYTGEVFVTLENAQDEFNSVKQGCRQEKNLDKSKNFLLKLDVMMTILKTMTKELKRR